MCRLENTGADWLKFRTPVGHGRSGQTNGLATYIANPLIYMAHRPGLEPGTYGLTGLRGLHQTHQFTSRHSTVMAV